MNSSRPRAVTRLGTLLATCGALLLCTSQVAMAAAPRDSKRLIVPGASIGSVSLGQEWRAARTAWGGGGRCSAGGRTQESTRTCVFDARRRGEADFEEGIVDENAEDVVYGVVKIRLHAWLLRVRDRISGVPPNLKARRVPSFAFERPYTSFRTAKGIRLGSSARSFRRAYPQAKRVRLSNDISRRYDRRDYAVRQGDRITIFEVAAGRVAGIDMRIHKKGEPLDAG